MIRSRIKIIDGFRAMAILSVVFYHFFSRWAPPASDMSLYPYQGQYNYFGWGYLGVEFFFIISGFVIAYTLHNTTSFLGFWKNRIVRLLPAMIIATCITYGMCTLFDSHFLFPKSHAFRNFLPSLTFISPAIFNHFSHLQFDYINGSYWSLWPEIQFYVLASIIFYWSKRNFLKTFIVMALLLIAANFLVLNIATSNKLNIHLPQPIFSTILNLFLTFNVIQFLPLFTMGILFYTLFRNKQENKKTSLFIKASFLVFLIVALYSSSLMHDRISYLFMFTLFICFIYFPGWLSFLENKLLVNIGICSYFLYLIHEYVGVLLINKLAGHFSPFGFVFTIVLIILLVIISILYTKKIDKRINAYFKKQ